MMPEPIPLVPQQAQTSPVQTSTLAATGAGSALLALQYFVHPVWPPPDAILTIVAVALTPIAHLMGRALFKRLSIVADKIDGPDDPPTATAEVTLSAEVKP